MTVLKLPKWNMAIGDGEPLLCIAGLNVLEDIDHTIATAEHLKSVLDGLSLPFVFKASFDKANRSSIKSYRGPGLKDGLSMLAEVKQRFNVPICTDIHEVDQAEAMSPTSYRYRLSSAVRRISSWPQRARRIKREAFFM